MKGFMAVLFFVALFSLMCAQAARIKWEEVTNTYPKSDAEFQAWTNSIPDDTVVHVPFVELFEYQRRVDILWTDYTNRMERIAKMQEKRKAAEEKRKAAEYRNEVRRKYRRK